MLHVVKLDYFMTIAGNFSLSIILDNNNVAIFVDLSRLLGGIFCHFTQTGVSVYGSPHIAAVLPLPSIYELTCDCMRASGGPVLMPSTTLPARASCYYIKVFHLVLPSRVVSVVVAAPPLPAVRMEARMVLWKSAYLPIAPKNTLLSPDQFRHGSTVLLNIIPLIEHHTNCFYRYHRYCCSI